MTKRTVSVLVIAANGAEQDELMVPVATLREDGAAVDIAADDEISTRVSGHSRGIVVTPTVSLERVDASRYDVVIVPGGTASVDVLRGDPNAVRVVTRFIAVGRTVAAIDHGVGLLMEAGVVAGRRLTSHPSLREDLRNAGGGWVDEPVVTDPGQDATLITARNPKDLDHFIDAIRCQL